MEKAQTPAEEVKLPLGAPPPFPEEKKDQPSVPASSASALQPLAAGDQSALKIPEPHSPSRTLMNQDLSPNLQPLHGPPPPAVSSVQLRPLDQVAQNIKDDLARYRKYILICTGFIIGIAIIFSQYLWYHFWEANLTVEQSV